jgi:predicted acyltransferase
VSEVAARGAKFAVPLSSFVSRSLENRDYVVDAVRGLAIAGMVLVNGAPPTQSIYGPLVHAPWHGWTLADTIFPLFLFIVGLSITFSLKPAAAAADGRTYWKILRRTAVLIAISLALVNFPYYELHKLIWTGVLTHIALCYLAVALLYLHTTWRVQVALIAAIWLVHWALLVLLDVPGSGAGNLTPAGNAARYVDQLFLGPHSQSYYDGIETSGVLTILSSISTTLIGLVTATWLRGRTPLPGEIAALFAAGCALFVLGSAWDLVLPVNKPLWTASYVALTAGISLQILAAGYWLMELRGWKSWAKPLQMAGVNALALYVLSQGIQRILVYGRITGADGSPVRLRYLIYEEWVKPWMPGEPGALVFALAILLVCFSVIAVLYRKKVFVKL